jgi:purine-binding chemotaxis protein CheW
MTAQQAERTAASAAEPARKAEKAEKAEKVDFKMISFSLSGKEYGIDIMSVKEIAKASRFTYVPNAAPFVRGVYNLRGEIIPVVDMRIFFHLPAERKQEDALESLIIVRVDEHVFGIIVDAIDKVVGIASSSIQAPHPIFGDINVKYIKGIVESSGKLYIILDVEKIFAVERPGEEEEGGEAAPAARRPRDEEPAARAAAASPSPADKDIAASFVRETLAAFRSFHVTAVNDRWFASRFAEWKALRKGKDLQLREASEADEYLENFLSPCTGRLWDEEYAAAVEAVLPEVDAKSINVWNPGCGKGYETWSLACVMKRRYPEARVKIWANDSDLLAISMAPNMVFSEAVPDYCAPFMTKGRGGLAFGQAIRDSIFFEFHDAMNANTLPAIDLILCRDMLSFLPPIDQRRLLSDFSEKLKPNGVVLCGANEALGEGWAAVGSGAVPAFRKD